MVRIPARRLFKIVVYRRSRLSPNHVYRPSNHFQFGPACLHRFKCGFHLHANFLYTTPLLRVLASKYTVTLAVTRTNRNSPSPCALSARSPASSHIPKGPPD